MSSAVLRASSPATNGGRRWDVGLRWLVGIGLLAVLAGFVGLGNLAASFARIDAGLALMVVGLSVIWLFLGGLKVWLLLRKLTPVKLLTFLPIYGTSYAALQLLPGQLGDASQVLLLRKYDVSVARSGAAYVADKTISLGWLFLVSAYGVWRFMPSANHSLLVLLPVLAIAGAIAGLALLRWLPARAGSLFARLRNVVWSLLEQLGSMRHHRGALLLSLVSTLARWLLNAAIYFYLFAAFDQALPFEAAATMPFMSSMVGYVPVTVGGAGTTEMTAVFLYGIVGAESAAVLAAYLFQRLQLVTISLLVVALSPLLGGRREAGSGADA